MIVETKNKISRFRLNIIIVSVADLLILLFISNICRLDIHSFHNSTALLPVLVRYKKETYLNIFFLSKLHVILSCQ